MLQSLQGSGQSIVNLWRVCASSRLHMARVGAAAALGPNSSVSAGTQRFFYGGNLYHEEGMLPSQITDTPWIWHDGNKANGPNGPAATGKWMLFYKKGSRLDHAWTQATALCAKGELYGVRLMKVSTAMVNPLAKDKEIGVLIMYSGNEQEAQETLQIGRNIVNKMKYESRSDYMYWKGDAKTLAGEYSRPGQSVSNYRVPTYRQAGSPPPADAGLPSQTLSPTWLRHPGNAGEYDKQTSGKWLLFYQSFKQLDKAWAKAKSLCESGQLPGVCSMVASTAANNSNTTGDGRSSPVILMLTPAAAGDKLTTTKEAILNIGSNIVSKMQYRNVTEDRKYMTWKAAERSRAGSTQQVSTGIKAAHQDTSSRPTTLQVPTFQGSTVDHIDIIYLDASPSARASISLPAPECVKGQTVSPHNSDHNDVIYIQPSTSATTATNQSAAECTDDQPASPSLAMQLSNQSSQPQPHRRRRRKQ